MSDSLNHPHRVLIDSNNKQVTLKFIDRGVRAGFYSVLGHTIVELYSYYTNSEQGKGWLENGYEILLDCSELWIDFKDTYTTNLYDILFEYRKDITLTNPVPLWGWHGVQKDLDLANTKLFLDKYFAMNSTQQKLLRAFEEQHNIDYDKIIGVCYRGTDKGLEVKLANPKLYVDLTQELLDQNPECRIFIQTDCLETKKMFLDTFKDKCFLDPVLPATYLKIALHLLVQPCTKLLFSRHLEMVCRILAKSKFLINHTGNMACAIAAYRGHAENLWQFSETASLIKPN